MQTVSEIQFQLIWEIDETIVILQCTLMSQAVPSFFGNKSQGKQLEVQT